MKRTGSTQKTVVTIDFSLLKRRKEERKLSTYKIAAADGVLVPETVQKIINGVNKTVQADNLARVCNVLDLRLDEVVRIEKQAA